MGTGMSVARGVSGDGSVVVGWFENALLQIEAFRWTEATGVVALGHLSDIRWTYATAVSGDGRVIVGVSDHVAFRWTQEQG